MATQVGRNRTESAARWEAALRRALDAGLEVFVVADTGERMVTSASKFDVLHRTDGVSCTCEAAVAGDPVCMHRAAVRFVLGWLALPEPVETAATISCPACGGKGWAFAETHFGDGWPEEVPCWKCHGDGRLPVVIRHTRPASTVAVAAD